MGRRVEKAQGILERAACPVPPPTAAAKRPGRNSAGVTTSTWSTSPPTGKKHAPMMVYAMEQGKHVACEVPAAMTLDEIWAG
jgi:hypothetical protein